MNRDAHSYWYLIHTKPKQEQTAVLNLQRQAYSVYLPYLKRHKRVRGTLKQEQEPLFARYLFIHLSEQNDDWGPIRSTRGVSGLVRFGGVAARVPDQLINLLQQRAEIEITPPECDVGDRVQILDGVMQGYTGIITEKNSNKRVKLLLDLVCQAAVIEVPVNALEIFN